MQHSRRIEVPKRDWKLATQLKMAVSNSLSSECTKRKFPSDDLVREVFIAAESGNADLLNEILQHMNVSEGSSASEADIEGRGQDCRLRHISTALFFAAKKGHVDVLSCLFENGADVNALYNDLTPLMIASRKGRVNAVTFLVEHGADMDLQDKKGKTALHYAVRCDSPEVAQKLFTLGASQLKNNRGLTPLLSASNKYNISVVEGLINRQEFTKEQRTDALELLGASLLFSDSAKYTKYVNRDVGTCTRIAFEYLKRGMEERFQDPSHPLLKEPMEPVNAYLNKRESQTLEELAQIEGDDFAIGMECLLIRERILGKDNIELLGPIQELAEGYSYCENGFDIGIGLYCHAMDISQHCNQSIDQSILHDLECIILSLIPDMVQNSIYPRHKGLLKVLELIFHEYDKKAQKAARRELTTWKSLLNCMLHLLQFFAKDELCGELSEEDNSSLSVLLDRLVHLSPHYDDGNTLLHLAAAGQYPKAWQTSLDDTSTPFGFPCIKTVKLLLNAGLNINATNNNGDTPLHRAATFNPHWRKYHLVTDMLKVLIDAGAHHDFVNNGGLTAMDVSINVRARNFLSNIKTLELKCITARAIKKFRLPYLGVVPKTLEKFISMH